MIFIITLMLIIFGPFILSNWLLSQVPDRCHPHTWSVESMNNDLGDSVSYIYCTKCDIIAGQDHKREST